ncbi:histidine kinase [Bernardetia sp. Wsw4-3y2]|uniref:sensor histidine kinase n=1 Tax=Bernardetia sp. Wsw4-3y2 TaxID=3127471 RepID=UPI0030D4BEFB
MKNCLVIVFLSLFAILSSCTETQEDISTEQLLKEIESTEPTEQEDKILFWKDMLNKDKYTSDKVVKAYIYSYIAESFGRSNIDSTEMYATKALVLIEDVEGFEKRKTDIYTGLGLIADNRGQIFLASNYYHKAEAILNANPSISTISAKDKIKIYLHNAQSTIKVGLYERTYDLTKKAESYLDSLPEGNNDLRFRIYSQIFVSGLQKRINSDSLRYYLNKIAQSAQSSESKQFYYIYKGHFFSQQEELDSAKIYYQTGLEMNQDDLKKELKNQVMIPANRYLFYCFFLENSIKRGKKNEADSIISILSEMKQNTSINLSYSNHITFSKSMMSYYYRFKDFDKYYELAEKVLEMTEEKQKKAELQAKEEMQTMYQLEENKRSIKKLNQSVESTENQLQKTKYFLAITILVILIILAILAILYYRQKSRKLQQEYEKVILEQKLLRTQMEPHFIFNTLSTLQSLIRFQEPKKAINYLNRFSRLLRSNLELSRQEMISLEDEIETIDNYLNLQQARFEDYFTYQIKVPNELEIDALFIPPMLIQPFVENSILHGFDGEKEWHIDIKITELTATKQLQIEIIDNGVGIHTNPKKKHKSLSGEIAKERLEILSKKYKIPTDYQIFSVQGKGTTVCLKLPIIDGFQQN